MSIKRNLKTAASRAFWAGVDATAARVDSWPAWMRGKITGDTNMDHFDKYYEKNQRRWHCSHASTEDIAYSCYDEGYRQGQSVVYDQLIHLQAQLDAANKALKEIIENK